MPTFDFFSVPRIVFGCGGFARAGEISATLGASAMIVYNGGESILQQLIALLEKANVRSAMFRQKGEPKVADIDAALHLACGSACDMVIGLGGGSAIDAAKAVAALLTNGGAALDYMEVVGKGQKITKPAAPWMAIPTTAGTGAEVTRNAVIGAPEQKFKASIRGAELLARVALIDPEIGVDVPPGVTASSGMDALCQCIESYTSSSANPMTDALALEGIVHAGRSLRRAVANGKDIEAREGMAMAALLSGITLTNAGLGAVHGFAAPLGANFPIPHGVVCAALLPHVIAANVAALRANDARHPILARYATIGRIFSKSPLPKDDDAIHAITTECARLAQDFAIPPLRQFGFAESDISPMVNLAKKASSMKFNPISLPDNVLGEILRKAI